PTRGLTTLYGLRGGVRVAGRCAHHSPLGLILTLNLTLSVLGLAGAAGGSVLGRGVGSVLRPRRHLLVRSRGILGIAQQLLPRSRRVRVSAGLALAETALASIGQRVR